MQSAGLKWIPVFPLPYTGDGMRLTDLPSVAPGDAWYTIGRADIAQW